MTKSIERAVEATNKNKAAPNKKILEEPTPESLVPRLVGDLNKNYVRLIDFAVTPIDLRSPKYLANKWGIRPHAASRLIAKFIPRVEPWDMHLAALQTKAAMNSYTQQGISLAQEHTEMWNMVREVGKRAVKKLLEDPNAELSNKEALMYLNSAFTADRLMTGEATEIVGVKPLPINMDKLTLEQKKQLRFLLSLASSDDGGDGYESNTVIDV